VIGEYKGRSLVSVVGFIILIFGVFLSMPWWMAKHTHWDAKHARWRVFNGYSKVPRVWGQERVET